MQWFKKTPAEVKLNKTLLDSAFIFLNNENKVERFTIANQSPMREPDYK
jgi:hypothetical protein